MAAKKKIDQIDNKAERIINEYHYGLDLQQQLYLENNISSKDLLKLTRDCFQDELLDEQSEQYGRVKNFLVKLRRGKRAYNFTDEEIEFITQNGPLMRPIDIARGLFPDGVGSLSKEAQTISQLCKALEIEFDDPDKQNDAVTGDYEPPRTIGKIIELINKSDQGAKYHLSLQNSDPQQRERVATLKKNMNSPRFVMVANSLSRKKLREFFEVEFARATYDKPDLTADENNQYISLVKAYVDEIILFEIIANLNDRLNEVVIDSGEREMKLHLSITEALETKIQEAKGLRSFITAQQKLLSGSRSERMKDQALFNASLSKFVQASQDEKKRQQLLTISRANNGKIEEEMKIIAGKEDHIAEIFGIDIQEILNF